MRKIELLIPVRKEQRRKPVAHPSLLIVEQGLMMRTFRHTLQ
jgi:hypothetical protein